MRTRLYSAPAAAGDRKLCSHADQHARPKMFGDDWTEKPVGSE